MKEFLIKEWTIFVFKKHEDICKNFHLNSLRVTPIIKKILKFIKSMFRHLE